LIPAGIGLASSALLISFVMSRLLALCYTGTFSVIFGLFISIIPSVLTKTDRPAPEVYDFGMNAQTVISVILTIVGLLLSFYLGDIKNNNKKIKQLFSSKRS